MDANRKNQIIKAAFKHFIQSGYEKTSLTEIADSLQITKPALYYYFKNKDELYRETFLFFIDELNTMFIQVLSAGQTMEESLRSSFGSFGLIHGYYFQLFDLEHTPEAHDQIFLKAYFFLYDAIARLPEAKEIMRSIYSGAIEQMTIKMIEAQKKGEVRDDIDPESFSFLLNATIEGSLLFSIFNPDINLEETGNKMFENIWKVLKKT